MATTTVSKTTKYSDHTETDTYSVTYTTTFAADSWQVTITKITHKWTSSSSAVSAVYPAGNLYFKQSNNASTIYGDFYKVSHSSYTVKNGGTVTVFSGSKTFKNDKMHVVSYFWLDDVGKSIFSIPAQTSYDVTFNANGGSGAPSKQTKWYGETLKLSSTKPSRSEYTFSTWNTNSGGTGTNYAPGANYTGNAALTLYAKWLKNYTISYNANGGNGAPENQTKVHGTNITLSSMQPTRQGYAFIKWNTESDGTGSDYSPGTNYTNNEDLILYAVWVAIPMIQSLTAVRCDENGADADEGEFCRVQCVWTVSGLESDIGTVTGYITSQDGQEEAEFTFREGASGKSGTAIAIVGENNGLRVDIDMQYTVSVTVTNQGQFSVRNSILTRAFYVMDWKAGGQAIGIGRAAPQNGLEIGYEVVFDDDAYFLTDIQILLDTSDPPDTTTTDGQIYKALKDLSWDSDVIV